MSSEIRSEMSSTSGDTGGVLYSCDFVLLLSDFVDVIMAGGALSWCCRLFCWCVLSCCWRMFCWELSWSWVVSLLFRSNWLLVFVFAGTIERILACSCLLPSCSIYIVAISLSWVDVFSLLSSTLLSKNTTFGLSCSVALILTMAFSILGVDSYEVNVCLSVVFSKPIVGLSIEVDIDSEGSFEVMILWFGLES